MGHTIRKDVLWCGVLTWSWSSVHQEFMSKSIALALCRTTSNVVHEKMFGYFKHMNEIFWLKEFTCMQQQRMWLKQSRNDLEQPGPGVNTHSFCDAVSVMVYLWFLFFSLSSSLRTHHPPSTSYTKWLRTNLGLSPPHSHSFALILLFFQLSRWMNNASCNSPQLLSNSMLLEYCLYFHSLVNDNIHWFWASFLPV